MRPVARLVIVVGVALDVGLLLLALAMGGSTVQDANGSVTTGFNVALSIAATLVFVVVAPRLRLGPRLTAELQAFALGAQAFHALGHLARLYYTLPWFDDVLHAILTGSGALLGLRAAQAWDLFPPRHATRLRVAVVVVVAGLALAGAWEIFEHVTDVLQGSREQDDLHDTMQDMIMGLGGSAAAASWAARRPVRA